MVSLRLPATPENLKQFLEFSTRCARENGFSLKRIREVELATEEVLANIIRYAYPGSVGDVEIRSRKSDADDSLIFEIRDNGIRFDPLTLPEPDLTGTARERKVGGLGVLFVRAMTDTVHYDRTGDANVLTLTFSQ